MSRVFRSTYYSRAYSSEKIAWINPHTWYDAWHATERVGGLSFVNEVTVPSFHVSFVVPVLLLERIPTWHRERLLLFSHSVWTIATTILYFVCPWSERHKQNGVTTSSIHLLAVRSLPSAFCDTDSIPFHRGHCDHFHFHQSVIRLFVTDPQIRMKNIRPHHRTIPYSWHDLLVQCVLVCSFLLLFFFCLFVSFYERCFVEVSATLLRL